MKNLTGGKRNRLGGKGESTGFAGKKDGFKKGPRKYKGEKSFNKPFGKKEKGSDKKEYSERKEQKSGWKSPNTRRTTYGSGAPKDGFKRGGQKTRDSRSFGKKPIQNERRGKSTDKREYSERNEHKSSWKDKGTNVDFKSLRSAFKRSSAEQRENKPFDKNRFQKREKEGRSDPKNRTKRTHKTDWQPRENRLEKRGGKHISGKTKNKERKLLESAPATKEDRVFQQSTEIRLNRYIANAGVCSRREADRLISSGLVSVNGKIISELGYKVMRGDDVRFNGQRLSIETPKYILLNKPKDAITTMEDPEGRRTIMDILGSTYEERIFPVGRLDRNTTGVLLLTNDGELAQRLMHPKHAIQKVYKATLNKKLKGEDLWRLTNGIDLEDGFIKPDAIAIPDPARKNEVGIEIHSGKNRIIHRMFEELGYLVDKLDRVSYAGYTKKGLKRGEWRELNEKEIYNLKRMVRLA